MLVAGPWQAYRGLCCVFLLLCLLSARATADEARAVVVDNVAHAYQEAVPPDSYPTDDGPLVSPIFHTGTPSVASNKEHGEKRRERYQIASVDFHHVSTPFIISLWIIIAGLAKIGFHVTPKISLICPESCLLIVVGVAIGLLLFYTGITHVGPLTPDIFFLYMLPPIVLDAGYYMPNRQFFNNLVSILSYAVLGTVWNAMMIGVSLWGVGQTGLYGVELPLLDTLLFSSIVSAVDPVAVLAVFEEIQVNEVLYILVFGESLLNDAVTVVLYHMFEGYAEMGIGNLITVDYVAGVTSFFVVALGGTLVGIIWGFVAAFISRFTHHVRVIEPLFIFVMAYLSYLSAELFHLSGILALTFCGITMKNYVEENISYKSHVTVKYTMKMLASSSETIIFMFLGVSTVNDQHEWNTWFVVMTILFCTIYRALGVIMLTGLANRFRLHRLNKVDQFIIAYGGLRGAVAFALVLVVSEKVIPTKHMMVTTVIAVVYFTVFIQGMTIGPLVRILNVPTANKIKPSMNERIHTRLMDHLMAGIEDIAGQLMGNYHMRDKFKYYNQKFLRPFLTRDCAVREPKIFETYSKLNLADAMNLVKQNGNMVPVMGNDNSLSLAHIFRSYTQANFGKSFASAGENSESSIPHNNSGLLNFDMGELEYCPSSKDMAEAEIHHILEETMFKPPKKQFRRYSRNHIYEPTRRPPFHHQMRMQIRHLVSENCKSRKKTKGHHHQCLQNGEIRTSKTKLVNSGAKEGNSHPHLRFQLPDLSPDSESSTSPMKETCMNKLSPSDSLYNLPSTDGQDDEGITFVARPLQSPDGGDKGEYGTRSPPGSPTTSRTVTETTLPWKRDEESEKCARQQSEFPSWIDNKEYLVHTSPTNTFLLKLGGPKRNLPPVFEIFDLKLSESQEDVFEHPKEVDQDSSKEASSSSGEKHDVDKHNDLYASLVSRVAHRLSKSSSSPPSDSTVVTIADEDSSGPNETDTDAFLDIDNRTNNTKGTKL